jgi:DNA-binding response OmpR family regulator
MKEGGQSVYMKRVLIIEDDNDIMDLLEIHLNDLHCQVSKASDGATGLHKGLQEKFDLIVLDLMLPAMNGIEVCIQLRTARVTAPILILTAKSEENERAIDSKCGAEDYLTKPFSVKDFIDRVKRIWHKKQTLAEEHSSTYLTHIISKDLRIDIDKREVFLRNKQIEVTPKEFDLLQFLASHPGKSYSREQLLGVIWGYEFNGYKHLVNAHINRLRVKIEEDLSNPKYILTSFGVGYRFCEETDLIPAGNGIS